MLVTGLLSLVAGYVLPFAAEFRLPQHTQPVALESLHVSQFAFPALRVPGPVRASAPVALPPAPVPMRATTTPHRQAQRAAVPAQRVRVPIVTDRYVLVPQPKPATKDDTSAPVYEESIGAMPDAMIDPATPDPVAQAAAQAADQERIAQLEAEAQARAEAAAAAAQAQAQTEAAAAAAAPSVTVTVAAPADTNANTVSTTALAADADATQAAPATPTEGDTIGAAGTTGGSETIAAPSGASMTSPTPNEIVPVTQPSAEPVASPSLLPDPPAASVTPAPNDPILIPEVNENTGALPIKPDVSVTLPAVTTATVGSSADGATAGSATGGDTQAATGGSVGTSGTGNAATAASDITSTTPAGQTTANAHDPARPSGAGGPTENARGPPEDATAISAADGGVATSADGGAKVSFAAGALLNDIYVTVTPSGASAPADVNAASPAYDLVAYNANGDRVERFGGAAELTIDYASAMPPRIYYLSPTDGAIQLDSVVDPATHTVRAQLVHFSTYVAATPADELAKRPPLTEATVDVTVLAPGGTPIVDALVQGTSDTGYEVRGHTDVAGTISLGVTRGMWTFSVSGVSNLRSTTQAVDTTTGSSTYALALGLDEFPVYVTGTVRDASGNPLAGVRVEARSESGSVRADDFALTGADGSYRLGGLLGQWSINGQDVTDYYPRSLESHYTSSASHGASLVVTGAATRDLTYTLMPRTLRGNLKDQNGDGVAGAAVHLEVYSHTFDYHFSTTVISAGDGSYAARLPSDVFRVDLRSELQPAGYADLDVESTTWNAPAPDNGDAVLIADFHYYRFSTSASGVARRESGTTVAGYTVAAEFYSALRARWFWIEAATDANGAWTISGDPAAWNIYPATSIVGHSLAALRGVAVGAGGLTNVELLLIAGAAVAGTVTFQDTGAAAAGVGIQVCGVSCAATRTNSLGEYVAWLAVDPQTRSSAATVRMLTGKTGYARSTTSITGAAGGRVVRDLLYVPFSTPYSGIVLDSFGTPVPGAVVHLSDGLDEALATAQADGAWAGLGPAVDARVSATGVFPTSGNSAILLPSAGATGLVLLLPASRLAGTVANDLGTTLAGVRIDAERWLCNFGAAHCDWADLFGSFYGQLISTVASTVTDSVGNYAFTLDPALFSDNFPLRLAPQRLAGHLTPGLITPTYRAGQVTDADVVYRRATIEIQGVANGGVYGAAVNPVIVTTPVFDAVEVTLNGASWTPGDLSADGAYTIVARALRSGAEVARAAVTFAIDTIAPVVTVAGVASGGAYAAAVTPDIVATDPNLAFTTITLDGSPFAGGAVSDEGRHVLEVSASDWAANAARTTIVFWVDATAPTTALTTDPAAGPFNDLSIFTLHASDDGSGVQATYWLLDAGPATSAPLSLSGLRGPHILSWYSLDQAGNTEASQSATLLFSRPTVSVGDISVAEGNSGATTATFVFTLSESAPSDVKITYSLAGGTATAGVDFVGGTGSATIAAGTTSTSVDVTINGDTALEPDETFTLTITGAEGADVADSTATGTILNDDVAQADLVLSKSVVPSIVVIGLQVVYRFDVTNLGPHAAQDVIFVDHIAAGVEFSAILASTFGTCSWAAAGRTVTCSSALLAPGATASATFRFQAAALGQLSNTATVESTTGDPNAANNTDTATLEVVPATPTRPDLLTADDSGLSGTDNLTSVTRPRFSVTAAPRVLVELVEGATVLGSAFADDAGVAIVEVDAALALADGIHSVRARARLNVASTPGELSVALPVTIDTVAPAAPVLDLPLTADSGSSKTDNVTNVERWEFLANTAGGRATVRLVEVSPTGRTAQFDYSTDAAGGQGGAFFFPDSTGGVGPDGKQGVWRYQARYTDSAGNVSAWSNTLEILFDSVAPDAPTRPDLLAADDRGASNSDDVTNVARPRFDSTAESGAALVFYVDDSVYTDSALVDGVHAVRAEATDLAGNVSARSDALLMTIDTVAPDAPTRPDLRAADDSGVLSDDDITNVNRPRFDTSFDSGTALTLSVDGAPYSGAALPDGAHAITATATDLAGNVSPASPTLTVKIDTTTPAGALELNDRAASTRDPIVHAAPSFTDVLGPYQLRFSLDGGATWSDWQTYTTQLFVTLPGADGIKTVVVQVRDVAGNVGAANDDIRLDRTGPALTITSPATGAVLDVTQIVALTFTAIDPSGIGSTSVTLDGRPLSGSSIDTFLLGPRSHTLVVTVVDALGNVSSATVIFEVHASLEGLTQAIRRAAAAGLIEAGEALNLLNELDRAARDVARGDVKGAARRISNVGLELFREAGGKVDAAFGGRAAGWAFDLAERLSAGSATLALAKATRGRDRRK